MGEVIESELCECRVCGAKSVWKDGFVDTRSVIHGPRKVCATCWLYHLKFRKSYWNLAAWVVVFVLIGNFLTRSVAFTIPAAAALYAIAYLAVVVHELGHAITAVALRVRVTAFSLGGGLRMKILPFRNTFVLLGPSPVEGLVLLRPSSTRHYRKKMALILAAGSLVNLLGAALGLYVLSGNGAQLTGLALKLAEAWTVISLIHVLNLLPSTSRGTFGLLRSDGRQLLGLMKETDEEIEKQVSGARLAEAHLAFISGDFARAHAAIERDLPSAESSGRGRVLATAVLVSMGKLYEGIEASRRYLAANGNTPAERALLMNNLAWALIDPAGGDLTPARLAEADELSSQAVGYLPMMNGVRGTRGTVLVAKGEYRNAVPFLTDKRFRLEARTSQATVKASLALALAGLGQAARAETVLREALTLDPANVHAQRAKKQLTRTPDAPEHPLAQPPAD